MFSKNMLFTTFFMLFTCLSKLAIATPPACVLACINDQPEVEDYEAICGDALEDVATCLREKCDGDLSKPALEHYVSVCGDAGIDVVIPSPTPSTKPTKSSTKTATETTSETATSTKSSNETSTETGTTETDAAGVDEDSASPKVVVNSMLGLVALLAGVIAL